ncbi:putative secreted protein [Streptomyces davaonensis JCM 4913]|uniref:Putative secreted protein n=1 Tax=Streptomyces davaonensis (strain DSM 101723 / JCM 4913 / KCC S-0913 / 768) TaxID=1214101 RepID=K4REK3_STRDJ|nr:putative secreted protein [Streptomyces davaonensis JCM 4913]
MEFPLRVRRIVTSALGAAAVVLTSLGTVTTASVPAAADPCGFFETGSDAFYNHCTSDGSNVVIKVEVSLAPDYERCVGPGKSWLGSASKIQGAYYTGRTC